MSVVEGLGFCARDSEPENGENVLPYEDNETI